MKWSMSHTGMAFAALATAALIMFAPQDSEGVVSAPKKPGSVVIQRQSAVTVPNAIDSSLLATSRSRVALLENSAGRLFSSGTWFVPPPMPKLLPVVAPPPPLPTAPALPYSYLGKYSEGDLQLVILSRGNRVVTASSGDVLENMYRIDRIETNNVIFTYLPLSISQTLVTGSNP